VPGRTHEGNTYYQSDKKFLYKDAVSGRWYTQFITAGKGLPESDSEKYLLQEATADGCPASNGWKAMNDKGMFMTECLDMAEWGVWSSWTCEPDQCSPKLYRTRSCYRAGEREPFNNYLCQKPHQLGDREVSSKSCNNSCWSNWGNWFCSRTCEGTNRRTRKCTCTDKDEEQTESAGACGGKCPPCLAVDDFAYNCNEGKYVQLGDLRRGDFVESFDFVENKYVCSKIAASHRPHGPGDFVKVMLDNGVHFSLTPTHMLYRKMVDGQMYERVTAQGLSIGDMVQISEGSEDSAFVVEIKVVKKIPISPQTLNTVIVVNNVTVSTLSIGDRKYGKGLVQLFDTFYDTIVFPDGRPEKLADQFFGELVETTRKIRRENFEANNVGELIMSTVEKYNGEYNLSKLVEQLEAVKAQT
jgi:hypothetical protein